MGRTALAYRPDGERRIGGGGGTDNVFVHDAGATFPDMTAFSAYASTSWSGAFEGYNGTIFAYGQTGSGKTWTIQGTAAQPGILPRAFARLFCGISQHCAKNPQQTILVRCSYLEVYNERVLDLLAGIDVEGLLDQPGFPQRGACQHAV